MKKVMLSLGVVAAAALSLVSCQKEISNPDENPAVKGTPFEIIATSADTKTVNKDLATEWAGGESINLFYAAAGETTYNNGGEFNTTDAGTSVKFNGTLDASKLGDSNDWYAFYPYSSYITTPANTSNGYSVVGSKFNAAQTQDGIDSKAHLAGDNLPMYAIASGVEKGTIPELAFHHLSSVIKVHVTNSTAEALTVSSVSFTAPEDIVGTYFIDFSSETPSYTASDAEKKYVSSTANLNVTSAEIAAGAAADFYLAIKPFTAKAGSTLKLAVNGNEKAIELTNDVTFTAGNIKPLNFNNDVASNVVTFDFSDPESLGITKPGNGKGTNITSPIISSDVTLTTTDGSTATRIWNSQEICDLRVYTGGSLTFSAPEGYLITKIVFTGSTTPSKEPWTGSEQSVKFTASSNWKISSATIYYIAGEPVTSINADNVTDLSAREGNFDLTYTITNPIEGTALEVLCDGTVVTEATASEGSISYSIAANTTTEAREGSITLTYGDVTKVITISQNAPVFKVSRTEVELAATANAKTTITLTSDFNWLAFVSDENSISVSPDVCNYDTDGYSDGKTTVTISAKSANTTDSATVLGTVTFTNETTEEELVVSVKQKGIAVLQSIAWTGYTTSYTVNDTFKKDGTVTATYSDGSTTNVTADATFSEPDMTTAGEKTITVTYEGKETTGTITVDEAGQGGVEQTIFLETFGDNGSSNTALDSYSGYTATQDMFTDHSSTVVSHYSSDGKVGKNNLNVSTGYEGASGMSAVWETPSKNTTTNLFTVDKINISNATDIKILFGLYYTNGAIGSTSTVKAYYTIDDNTEQVLTFTQPSKSGSWKLCSGAIDGTGSSLKVRFELTVTGGYTVRIDDIKVVGTK